jgi:ATP-binding cassette subfamily B (MDR/TAP) protein 1
METPWANTTTEAPKDPREALYGVVEAKLADFDPKDENDEESEFTTTEKAPLSLIIGRQADGCDKCLMFFGALSSTLFGVANPAMMLLFGEMVDSLGEAGEAGETGEGGVSDLRTFAFYQLYVGIGAMVFAGLQISLFSSFSERIAFKTRIQYFERCLAQDAAFYDEHNPTEMAAKISKETSAIQRGLGDKVGNILMSIVAFVAGFVFAFWWGWLLSVVLLASFPFMVIMASGLNAAM